MFCSKCGNEVKEDASFCSKCGNSLQGKQVFCQNCGQKISNNSDFCTNCGQSISEPVHEKKKTINAEDINLFGKKSNKKIKQKNSLSSIVAIIVIIIVIVAMGSIINSTTSQVTNNYSILKAEMSEEQINKLNTILKECDINSYSITRDTSLDGFENENSKGYRIKDKSSNFNIVGYSSEGNIIALKYADKYLYKDGQVLDKLSNYYVTSDERVKIKTEAELAIPKLLKSPSTAKFAPFSQWKYGKEDGYLIAQAYVDSQNSLGATLRANFQIKMKDNKITSLILDGTEYIK